MKSPRKFIPPLDKPPKVLPLAERWLTEEEMGFVRAEADKVLAKSGPIVWQPHSTEFQALLDAIDKTDISPKNDSQN